MEENTPSTKLEKAIYNTIDAMFWLVDETNRWWNIGKIAIQLKQVSSQKDAISSELGQLSEQDDSRKSSLTEELTLVNKNIAELSLKSDEIKQQCWAYTPILYFLGLFLLFIVGVLCINPIQSIIDRNKSNIGVFAGQISKVRDIPFSGHSIISSAKWFNNKLYVGGNNGVTEIDLVSGQSQNLQGLPNDFFTKDMQVTNNSMLIAGYPGLYRFQNNEVKSYYPENRLPYNLINSIAVTPNNQILMGTLGHGILKGNQKSATIIPNTYNYIIESFGHQKKQLWLLHEEGILTGNTDNLAALELQVLVGKNPKCMTTTENAIFIGTDHGVIAGFRNSKNWVWTILSSGNPGFVNDIVNAGDVIFIAAEDGVYRYHNGKMDRLSKLPTQSLCLCDTFLAAVNKSSILLYYFDIASNVDKTSIFGAIPELGTYTPTLPIAIIPQEKRFEHKKLPDFGLLETDREGALGESSIDDSTTTPDSKPIVELPIELQKPIFSDVLKANNIYYLTTQNRGIWKYSENNWKPIEHIGKNKVTRLCSDGQHNYAYDENSGLFEIIDDKTQLVISEEATKNLKNITCNEDNSLTLLFKDGHTQLFKDNELIKGIDVPNDYISACHSVWTLNNHQIAVLDHGIMIHDNSGKWNLMFFQGNINTTKVVDVKRQDKMLYIALNNGRIFRFANDQIAQFGMISDYPTSISLSDNIWVAGKESLYFKDKSNFVATSYKNTDKILGTFQVPSKKMVLIFTTAGLNIIENK